MSEINQGSSRRRTSNTGTSGRSAAGTTTGRGTTATPGRRATENTGRSGSTGAVRNSSASAGKSGSAHGGSSARSASSNTVRSSHGSSAGGERKRSSSYGGAGSYGSGGHGTGGHGSGGGNYRRKKKKTDATQILMYGIGIVILIFIIVLAVKGFGKLSDKDKESTEATDVSTTVETSVATVSVNGLDISKMSQEEAKTAVLNQYGWDMKVTYQDKEASITNLMEPKLNELLEKIYAGDEKGIFEVDTTNMLDVAKAEAALIAGNWNMVGKNGGISGYDKSTGQFTFNQGSNGIAIDQDKLAQDIIAAIEKKDYKTAIAAQTKEVAPDMTAAQLKEKYKTIATYTTKATNSSNRNENIRLACEALNGVIVNPGQEFSFNEATGARTEAKGYKPATAYLNGEIVQEPGGGVCQISSTLYNAVVFAGLTSTERHAHSYEPSYVTPGEDAAVSFGGPDFRFVNNSDYPIAIKTSFVKQELAISIYGVPILKEGEKVRMASEKVGTLAPPASTYEEDPFFPLNEEKVIKEGTPGSSWKTYLVKYQDGNEVSREFFHNSSYRGKAGIIKRNTSGVVQTTVAVTEAPTIPETVMPENPTFETNGAQGPAGAVQNPTQPTQISPGGVGPGGETTAAPSPISPGGGVTSIPPIENPVVANPGQTGPIGPGTN